MDIKRSTNNKDHSKRSLVVALSLVAGIALTGWLWAQPSGAETVSNHEIWTDHIRQGDLVMEVAGYGKLKSKQQRLLSAPANATVDEIVLKPGALVTAQSIILRLTNPDMAQQVKAAKRELVNRQTGYRQLELNQQREMLGQKAQLESLLSELEVAELEMTAQQQLLQQGIVSALDVKRSQLQQRQFSRRLAIEQQRLQQLEVLHRKGLQIEQEKIAQQQEQIDVVKTRFDKLVVRAGIDGVLQNLPVKLGQSVVQGQQVALVGSVASLYAMLNIPQSQMGRVKMRQTVEIDTRDGKVAGLVSRISPLVEQGNIAVEIELTGTLPAAARPELAVDGVIFSGQLTNIRYLRKPVNAKPGSSTRLFRISADKTQAEQVAVTFGEETGQYMQIVAGAKPGERFILSDMSRWQDFSSVTLSD